MVKAPIKFIKMHGLGNDFIVIDAIQQNFSLKDISIPDLSDRHRGIGFDQLLLIEKGQKTDFACRIFNADGGEAEQCGNGVRCVARFLHENHSIKNNHLLLETKAGVLEISIPNYQMIEVNMGNPEFFSVDSPEITALSLGNPHAIVRVSSVKNYPVEVAGKKISTLPSFPKGANVGFMEILEPNHIKLRTYERGTGETFACGSNACAAVATGIKNKWLEKQVRVELALGNLQITWDEKNQQLKMSGPAEKVFVGEIN